MPCIDTDASSQSQCWLKREAHRCGAILPASVRSNFKRPCHNVKGRSAVKAKHRVPVPQMMAEDAVWEAVAASHLLCLLHCVHAPLQARRKRRICGLAFEVRRQRKLVLHLNRAFVAQVEQRCVPCPMTHKAQSACMLGEHSMSNDAARCRTTAFAYRSMQTRPGRGAHRSRTTPR